MASLLRAVLFGLGVVALALGLGLPLLLQPTMFWSAEQSAAFAKADRQFVEILVAYRQENARRAESGKPLLKDRPLALRIAERQLSSLQEQRRQAVARPRQIAAAFRYTGAGLLFAFLIASYATRVQAGKATTAPLESHEPDGSAQQTA